MAQHSKEIPGGPAIAGEKGGEGEFGARHGGAGNHDLSRVVQTIDQRSGAEIADIILKHDRVDRRCRDQIQNPGVERVHSGMGDPAPRLEPGEEFEDLFPQIRGLRPVQIKDVHMRDAEALQALVERPAHHVGRKAPHDPAVEEIGSNLGGDREPAKILTF